MASFNVLVVDDSYAMARATSFLMEQAGHKSSIALDGVEALEKVKEEKPDLIILDLRMPRMDGIETCRRLRDSQEFRDVPIIVVTAEGEDEELAQAREAGADDCLTKPFNPPDLIQRVEAMLEPAETR